MIPLGVWFILYNFVGSFVFVVFRGHRLENVFIYILGVLTWPFLLPVELGFLVNSFIKHRLPH